MEEQNILQSSLFGDTIAESSSKLNIVQATFESFQQTSFEELIAGYSSLKVLTYSNSVSIINKAAEALDDLELIFGREDILNGMAQYLHYQELLISELIKEVEDKDYIKQKIDEGKIKLHVVKDIISHEKLFLLEGEEGTRVITGSANFSDKAFSGNQNESYICFDNDTEAWRYFNEKYEKIKANSTMSITEKAVLDNDFDVENLPVFNPNKKNGSTPKIILVQDTSPEPTVISKVLSQKTPKQYQGISEIIKTTDGVAKIDRQTANRAVQYVKSNARTEQENPKEYLDISLNSGKVILSGKEISLAVSKKAVKSDTDILLEYFSGYDQFRGDVEKMMFDYFTFMSWLYISPLICDFRNRALANGEEPWDYPVFGILYGKSNCGKSKLIETLLLSMFQMTGFLQNEWFTQTNVANLRGQNKRFPMVFDDLDKTRFSNHAVALIKQDRIGLPEYPAIVLSMNAGQDTFETELRKRSLIIYTDASLPVDTGEGRKLGRWVKRITQNLSNALYCEYLKRALENSRREMPTDILRFSSTILYEIFDENCSKALPNWCRSTSMNEYEQDKYHKVKNDLLELWAHYKEAWTEKGNAIVLKLDDTNRARKLLKDIPDYIINSASGGDAIIFNKDELEAFCGVSIKGGIFELFSRLMKRAK